MSPGPRRVPKDIHFKGKFIGEPKSVCATKIKHLGKPKAGKVTIGNNKIRTVFDGRLGQVMAKGGMGHDILKKTEEQKRPGVFLKSKSRRNTIYRRAAQLATLKHLDIKPSFKEGVETYSEEYTNTLKHLVKFGVPEAEHAAAWKLVLKDHTGRIKK